MKINLPKIPFSTKLIVKTTVIALALHGANDLSKHLHYGEPEPVIKVVSAPPAPPSLPAFQMASDDCKAAYPQAFYNCLNNQIDEDEANAKLSASGHN